jgi:hypothetical protein
MPATLKERPVHRMLHGNVNTSFAHGTDTCLHEFLQSSAEGSGTYFIEIYVFFDLKAYAMLTLSDFSTNIKNNKLLPVAVESISMNPHLNKYNGTMFQTQPQNTFTFKFTALYFAVKTNWLVN